MEAVITLKRSSKLCLLAFCLLASLEEGVMTVIKTLFKISATSSCTFLQYAYNFTTSFI